MQHDIHSPQFQLPVSVLGLEQSVGSVLEKLSIKLKI